MSKKNINNITFCEVDKTQHSSMNKFLYHLRRLNISEKEYYDKYLKKENEGVCPICKNESLFLKIGVGYSKFCSLKCSHEYKKLPEIKSVLTKKAKQTKLKRYGHENYVNIEKCKKTKLERYGNENYVNSEKNKETCLRKYGRLSFSGTEEYKIRHKKTCLEKYGTEHHTQSEVVKRRCKKTNNEKYGVDYYTKTEECKKRTRKTVDEKYGGFTFESESLNKKQKSTMLKKYGTDIALRNEEIKQKQQKTNLDKYGGITPTKNKDVILKIKKTNLEKYGVENTFNTLKTKNTFMEKYGVINPSQIQFVKDKTKETCLEKYGDEIFLNSEYFKEKSKETCLRKYGVENVMQNPEMYDIILSNSRRKFKLKKYTLKSGDIIKYQSASELEFIKICELNNIEIKRGPVISYTLNNKNKKYYSDYIITENNGVRIVEIKRKHPWWFQDLKRGVIKAKTKAAIEYSKRNGYLPYKILFETKMYE